MATAIRAPQIGLIRLNDLPDGDGFHRSWVMVLPEGEYQHDEFGNIDLTRPVLDEMVRNFTDNARGIDIALDYDHQASKGESKAPGWIEALQYRPAAGETPAGLWANVRWTEIGLSDVKGQIYRYLSAEFKPTYKNDITGKSYHNVLVGLTLTNRPYMKHMPAIKLSEVSTRAWSSVNKSELPDSCFLDSANRRLPIYEGAGTKGADGRYTKRGKLNLNGLHAALAAVHGAHTGKAMTGLPAGTVARIERLAAKYSKSDESADGGMGMADLNDMSLYEDEAESAHYELADTKKQAKGKVINKNKPDDDNEDDEGMEYDDGDDDAAEMDDGDSDADEYAEEDADSGDDDIDHLPARQKNAASVKGKGGSKGGSSKMSEQEEALTLDEMRRELAALRRENYASKAEVILKGFEAGSFQFSATEARTVSKRNGAPLDGKTIMRSGNYKLAPKALKAVRAWLTSDAAYTLSESSRREVLGVFETIAAGVVDLSVRGSSHDMERQKTVVAKSPTYQAVSKPAERDLLLTETAGEIAAERGKDLDTLRQVQRQPSREGIEAAQELQRIYALAERRVTAGITAAE
ncbi:MAG TPA: phage protease [Ktedonobacterales bacterium]|nr:phage protease [Ktedonobacterales bacterium]